MPNHDRRTFIKQSAMAFSAVAVTGCGGEAGAGPDTPTPLDPILLRAVGSAVLPPSLDREGLEDAISDFENWLEEYQPVVELNHGYGTHEIRYGPPDPAPRWGAQLDALELEALKRFETSFAELSVQDRRSLIRRNLSGVDSGALIRQATTADHVAVGILARFYARPIATDFCYQARIQKLTCRGLGGVEQTPEPLRVG